MHKTVRVIEVRPGGRQLCDGVRPPWGEVTGLSFDGLVPAMGTEGWSLQALVTIRCTQVSLRSNILPESQSAVSGPAPRRTHFTCNEGVARVRVKATSPLDRPPWAPTHVCIRNAPHHTCALPVGKWDPCLALSQTSAFAPKSVKPARIARRFLHVRCPPALGAEFHVEDHFPARIPFTVWDSHRNPSTPKPEAHSPRGLRPSRKTIKSTSHCGVSILDPPWSNSSVMVSRVPNFPLVPSTRGKT